ncbi:MAG: hypothetical protein HYX68_10305 [Planctomycetes bacterium]|nr:hypothetical protein [Planctomycetota bacterium]
MASGSDIWYVRLPDGRVLRARSTEALRHYLKSGRIPWESRARRSSDDPWQTMDAWQEFADLAAPDDASLPREKSRTTGPELRTLGMRGLVEELFTAFDSCLQRAKLTTAAFTGLGFGVVMTAADVMAFFLPVEWAWAGVLLASLLLLVLFSLCTSIITQMTALELSRFRLARFSEIRPGLVGAAFRLTCALTLVGGALAALILLLRLAPGWFASDENPPGLGQGTLLNVLHGARMIVEAICWPIFGFAMLLMGPTLMVEEFSIVKGIREWLGMIRQHLGRIYLYQAVAFAFAALVTLPLLIPVLLAFGFAGGPQRALSLGETVTFHLLLGIALTPMLSYLLVAHVFIYLNLRYEFFYSARER